MSQRETADGIMGMMRNEANSCDTQHGTPQDQHPPSLSVSVVRMGMRIGIGRGTRPWTRDMDDLNHRMRVDRHDADARRRPVILAIDDHATAQPEHQKGNDGNQQDPSHDLFSRISNIVGMSCPKRKGAPPAYGNARLPPTLSIPPAPRSLPAFFARRPGLRRWSG